MWQHPPDEGDTTLQESTQRQTTVVVVVAWVEGVGLVDGRVMVFVELLVMTEVVTFLIKVLSLSPP